MEFRKMLLVISIVIISMFGLMLTTSYAWYSFNEASTTFEAVTETEDIYVSYQDGEYINTDIAVPVNEEQIDKYSSKNNFNIKVVGNGEIMIGASLIDVVIDKELNNDNFIIDLFYQGSKIDSISGSKILTGEDIVFENVLLEDIASNQFEIRMYILDDGTVQNNMMGKRFSAKVKVDVVSRLNPNLVDYENSDIKIEKIVIDGKVSESIPEDGYYIMNSSCSKGSQLRWDALEKTILYVKGSYINDTCDLTFTSSNDYPLLNEMRPGSYIKYIGVNGCDGNNCSGENANYKNDDLMGYCGNERYQYTSSGWKIGYILNGNAYLISAGSPECMCSNSDSSLSNSMCSSYLGEDRVEDFSKNINKVALKYCNLDYAQGGICDSSTTWAMNIEDFKNITNNTLNKDTCFNSVGSRECGYNNNLVDIGGSYWINGISEVNKFFDWDPSKRFISSYDSSYLAGVRPIVKIDSSIVVIGGRGTLDNPYIIKNINK